VSKTRLALAVAEELDETFADGVVFVDLAPVVQPDEVVPAIARTLGIRDDGVLPLVERLANALRTAACCSSWTTSSTSWRRRPWCWASCRQLTA